MNDITRNLTLILACALLGAGCTPDLDLEAADANGEAVVTPAGLGLGDDWIAVDDGLWTRVDSAGEQEFVGIGEAGTVHAIASLETIEEQLARVLATAPGDQTREQLDEVRGIIQDLRSSPLTTDAEQVTSRCSVNVSGSAYAQPIACGVSASASASFSNTCDTKTLATIRTFVSATCNDETKTSSCGPRIGNPVSCNSSTSILGSGSCSSYASAQFPGAFIWKENYQKGACGGGGGVPWL